MHSKIEEVLRLAVANKASDVHLSVGFSPKIRIHGELADVSNMGVIEDESLILSLLSEEQKQTFYKEKELDISVTIDKARFRTNVYTKKGVAAAVLRVIQDEIPDLAALNLPDSIKSFTKLKQGFILITGPTGHGKSTTVASMINEINKEKAVNIVTIEDPVEYIIKPIKSIVSQRELGGDTLDFTRALKSTLRQDPNIVFVGEMRDLETIQLALTVAETGHLVFSTLHTNSAAQTIDRIVDVFPEGVKPQIRLQLASVLSAVISQRLVPAINGGRVPAVEILTASNATANTIREAKTFMIDNIIQTGVDLGMMSLEMSLASLVKKGLITEETAMSYSLKPTEMQANLRSLKINK
ncbi:MAG TPA: PilT/PilU family type 4a pilus ATPase [Candidatus Woesebacteria bacterium]|nr:PilT/PilU family type 4a pilus ATPase [Candidatus Woesebacteria bacterium]HPR99869.1 PilT/PilU family type 4a pilus ATPase [Candidatus Woesebacteria bacterium]